MNTVHLLSNQPWVERLGWTLLHFFWQGTLIALVYAVARGLARRAGPNTRYLLACLALATMVGAPLVTWLLLGRVTPVSISKSVSLGAESVVATPAHHFAAPAPFNPPSFRIQVESSMPWVVAVWLAGSLIFCLRLVGGWAAAIRLRLVLVRPPSPEWQERFDRLKTRLGISNQVRLMVSSLAVTPMVVGWIRPLVLFPVSALTGLEPEQVELLLLHELAHVRRCDYLVNILQSIAEALLFYHPAVWWVSGHIRAEREMCCDDAAISCSGDVLAYARALADLESGRPAHARLALAASGGSLAHRISRILVQSRPTQSVLPGPSITAALILLATVGWSIFAQSTERPNFEVFSIKPSQDMSFFGVRVQTGRLSVNAPLRFMIQNAYRLQGFQIASGPHWIESDRYTIEAKADGNPGRERIMQMLQTLLEDRFQLKAHRETRELPVYNLVTTKSGVKQPPAAGYCTAFTGNAPPPPSQAPAPCGHLIIYLNPGGIRVWGDGVPMTELSRIVAVVLGRSVIDKTGFNGNLNVNLEFAPDETTAGITPPPPSDQASGPAPPADPGAPSIFTVIQQELGLKLESAKGPVEMLVIDQVKRPSAN